MKNSFLKGKILLPIIALTLLISSCGFNNHLTTNQNNSTTQVELTKKNFKVIDKVSASVEVEYILGFGGVTKKSLAEMAKAKLYEEAGLEGKSRAIINITIEEHITNYLVVIKRTVIASGYVIEFTD